MVVVGAGVAGTTAAYLASQRHPEWRCLLLEKSSRVGGRLLSLAWPGIEGVRAELGGMRFRTSQPHISALVEAFSLSIRPFLTVFDENRLALRALQWRGGGPGGAPAAHDPPGEGRGMGPAETPARAFAQNRPGGPPNTD